MPASRPSMNSCVASPTRPVLIMQLTTALRRLGTLDAVIVIPDLGFSGRLPRLWQAAHLWKASMIRRRQ